MPYFSAIKFFNTVAKPTYLSAFERTLYVQRPEEAKLLSLLNNSCRSFFEIVGPRKSGKSTLLRHLADYPLKNSALYLKFEQKLLQTDELYKSVAKTVGYHSYFEESILSSIFCFWRMFQEGKVDRHNLEEYLEKVGEIYKKLSKGKLPVIIIDGAASLARKGSVVLDDMAYLAKSLADSKSMVIVFGTLEGFYPHMLNSRGYNITKQRIYISYMTQEEVMKYAEKLVNKDHPLQDLVLKAVSDENKRIYGGNLQYVNLLLSYLQNVKNEYEVKDKKEAVEEVIRADVSKEIKKTILKSGLDTEAKNSMYMVFNDIRNNGKISLDEYLSFFEKKSRPVALEFLNHQMVLREEKDYITFQGQVMKYYIENYIVNNYTNSDNKEKESDEYRSLITSTIITPSQNVTWSDLVGLDQIKQQMIETIVLPTLNPSLFTGLRTPVHEVLFYGPPGNGKTMIARVIASECKDITFFNLSSSTFSLSSEQNPEKLVKTLFEVACECQPAVIFIDEMDSILAKDAQKSQKVKDEFLTQLEAIEGNKRIVIIGATNRPFDLDKGILKKFPIKLFLELPCAEARLKVMKKMTATIRNELKNSDYEEIVKRTNYYSFADLSALCREASYQPIREIPQNKLAIIGVKDIRPVTLTDFEEAFKRVNRSVTEETLSRLVQWNQSGI